MALGRLDMLIEKLRSCTTSKAEEAIAMADNRSRAVFVDLQASLKNSLCDFVGAKLQYWTSLPWRFLGVFGHVRGVCSLERSAEVARGILAEVDAAVAMDGGSTLHRVIRRLCVGNDNVFRTQLQEFGQGRRPLVNFPELFVELRAYAMTPTVSRRVEGVHALVSRYGKKVVRFHPQLANAFLGKAYILMLLEHPQFYRWALTFYNKRSALRHIVGFTFGRQDQHKLRLFSKKKLEKRLFLSDAASQFRKVDYACESRTVWKKAVPKARVGPVPVSGSRAMLVDFARDVFCKRPSAIFSLPSPCFEHAAVQWGDCSPADLVDTLEMAAGSPRVPYEARPDEVFFKVLSAHPTAKKLLRSSHTACSTTTASVCICDVSEGDPLTWTLQPSRFMLLDLACLGRSENLHAFKVWRSDGGEAEACVSDEIIGQLAGQWSLAPLVVVTRLKPLLDRLVSAGALVQAGAALAFSDLWSLDTPAAGPGELSHLHMVGVMEVSTDEFGEMVVALNMQACVWGRSQSIMAVARVLRHRLPHDDWSKSSKLAMIVELLAQGWSPRPFLGDGHVGDDRRFFSVPMLSRSRFYFVCLLNASAILGKGAMVIMDGKPESYYHCLLRLPDISKLRTLPDFERLKHSHFVEMLRQGKVFVDPSWWAMPIEVVVDEGDLAPLEESRDDGGAEDDQLALVPLPAPVPSMPTKYDVGAVVVHLDGCSHASGKQRLWVSCKQPGHIACVTYRQFDGFVGGLNEAVAWMAEWHVMGPNSADKAAHGTCEPDAHAVAARLAEM